MRLSYAELARVYRLFKNHSSNSLSDRSIPLHSSCDTWRNVQFDECHPAAVELARYQEKWEPATTKWDTSLQIEKSQSQSEIIEHPEATWNTGTDGHFKCCLYLLSTQAPLNAMQLPYRLLRHITDFEDGWCYRAADSHAKDVLKTRFMKHIKTFN